MSSSYTFEMNNICILTDPGFFMDRGGMDVNLI